MALAIASGTESDVIQKNNHNDTMTNPDTISWHVASTQVQRTQLQYLSMAITVTNKKTISRPMIAWRREFFVTDEYEDNDKQQMQYFSMTIVLQKKDNNLAYDSLEAGNFCD